MKNALALFEQFVETRSQDIPDEISLDDILDLLQDNEELQFFTSSTLEDDGNIVNKVSWGAGTPVCPMCNRIQFGAPLGNQKPDANRRHPQQRAASGGQECPPPISDS